LEKLSARELLVDIDLERQLREELEKKVNAVREEVKLKQPAHLIIFLL
jgi:hypothetical protein